jgi:hypothetical protein
VPVIIVAVSAGLRWDDYGSTTNCWINNRNYALWSFVGPMLGIIGINIVVYALVMRNVLGINRKVCAKSSQLTEFIRPFCFTSVFKSDLYAFNSFQREPIPLVKQTSASLNFRVDLRPQCRFSVFWA